MGVRRTLHFCQGFQHRSRAFQQFSQFLPIRRTPRTTTKNTKNHKRHHQRGSLSRRCLPAQVCKFAPILPRPGGSLSHKSCHPYLEPIYSDPLRTAPVFFDQKVSQQPRRLTLPLRGSRCQEHVCLRKARSQLSRASAHERRGVRQPQELTWRPVKWSEDQSSRVLATESPTHKQTNLKTFFKKIKKGTFC